MSSSWHGKSHEGALLKVEFMDGKVGHSDLHPWPELGDPTLKECFRKGGVFWNRTLWLAHQDADWRARGGTPFCKRQLPLSHFLLPNFDMNSSDSKRNVPRWLAQAVEKGYQKVKMKMGRNLPEETRLLKKSIMDFSSLMWRLDFNGKISLTEFSSWFEINSSWLASRLDFVEDVRCDGKKIKSHFLPKILMDRLKHWSLNTKENLKVYKPEIEVIPKVLNSGDILTNNLGHPLGHSQALALATLAGCEQVCGLQGLEFYDEDIWPGFLKYFGPVTLAPRGLGFGGDEYLRTLVWKRLN
ncbi:MAG: hypothetical protein K1X29_04355 [Bdellovibrionales bacterium]|nr:hypothetical protein [Bdellovibrionales bacterium]